MSCLAIISFESRDFISRHRDDMLSWTVLPAPCSKQGRALMIPFTFLSTTTWRFFGVLAFIASQTRWMHSLRREMNIIIWITPSNLINLIRTWSNSTYLATKLLVWKSSTFIDANTWNRMIEMYALLQMVLLVFTSMHPIYFTVNVTPLLITASFPRTESFEGRDRKKLSLCMFYVVWTSTDCWAMWFSFIIVLIRCCDPTKTSSNIKWDWQ